MATRTQQRKERAASRAFLISVIAVIISAAALGWQIYQSVIQKRNYERHLGNIDASLRLLTATVAPQLQKAIDDSLMSALKADTPQALQSLAKVETETVNLRKLGAKLPPKDIDQSASLLAQAVALHPNSSYGWAAAAQMVSYRSDLRLKPTERPDCYLTQAGGDWHLSSPVMKYHDCTLNLDDIIRFNALAPTISQGPASAPTATGRILPTIFLQNGTVAYSGKKMIAFERLICQNCSFNLLSPEEIPPPSGRALSEQLLVADLAKVSLSLPKENKSNLN